MADMEAVNEQHDEELKARRKALEKASRTLHGGDDREPHAEFERMADWCRTNDVEFDRYGEMLVVEIDHRRRSVAWVNSVNR